RPELRGLAAQMDGLVPAARHFRLVVPLLGNLRLELGCGLLAIGSGFDELLRDQRIAGRAMAARQAAEFPCLRLQAGDLIRKVRDGPDHGPPPGAPEKPSNSRCRSYAIQCARAVSYPLSRANGRAEPIAKARVRASARRPRDAQRRRVPASASARRAASSRAGVSVRATRSVVACRRQRLRSNRESRPGASKDTPPRQQFRKPARCKQDTSPPPQFRTPARPKQSTAPI